jgi:hypothetical protein
MKLLKLMPDYQCFPIWNLSPGEYGDVNPAELPISKVLQLDLSRWAAAYDGTLNLEYPRPLDSRAKKQSVRSRRRGRGYSSS